MKRSKADPVMPGALVGRFERKLGRDRLLTIPAEWVSCLGTSRSVFVIPDPHERCLNIMPSLLMESEMAHMRANVRNGNNKETLDALRVIATVSERVEMDRRHRIRISDKLLDYAGIVDRAVLLGEVRCIKVRGGRGMTVGALVKALWKRPTTLAPTAEDLSRKDGSRRTASCR